MYNNNISEYEKMLNLSYMDLVHLLKKKYGCVKGNYYNEQSYNNFLNPNTNRPKRPNQNKKYRRTSDGLFCHHVKESEYPNLSNPSSILNYKDNGVCRVPYCTQIKTNLVYCNLVEHAILHTKILSEYKKMRKYGIAGTIGNVRAWYIDIDESKKPKKSYLKNCYDASYLTHDDAVIIYNEMQSIIGGKQVN